MRVGEIWIDIEDGDKVKITKIHDDIVYYDYYPDDRVSNYLDRIEFLEAYERCYEDR
jgi:hypothetical protein